MSEATRAMQTVRSGYVDIEMVTPIDGEPVTMRIKGDFQTPNRSQTITEIRAGFFTITLEMILIGADPYIRPVGTEVWSDPSESSIPFLDELPFAAFGNILSFGAFTTDLDPEVLAGFILVGEELINGERTYYVRGTVGGQALAELLDNPVSEGEMANAEFWIGVDDSRIRKVSILPTGSVGTSTLPRVTATVSYYDKAVDIQAPV